MCSKYPLSRQFFPEISYFPLIFLLTWMPKTPNRAPKIENIYHLVGVAQNHFSFFSGMHVVSLPRSRL